MIRATAIGTGTGNMDYVTVKVVAADGMTVLASPTTKFTSSYSVSVTTTGASRYVTIYFYFNNMGTGTPDRTLPGIDGNDARSATIDIGMVATPANPTPPTTGVTIAGKLYEAAGGVKKLTPADQTATEISVTDSAGTRIQILPLNAMTAVNSYNPSTFSYQFTLVSVPTIADKTIIITYNIAGTTWTVKGVVGGGEQQAIDICNTLSLSATIHRYPQQSTDICNKPH